MQKYPNRRLYDRTSSRHLTHEQLHDLVASGRRVQVNDSRSGEDITNLVLAQVLLEHDPLKLAAFPSELFHLIIRTNHRLLPSVQRAMFDATAALSSGWNGWSSLNERFPAIAPLTAAANPLAPFAWWLGGAERDAAAASPRGAAPGATERPAIRTIEGSDDRSADAEHELESLRAELAELESRMRAVRHAVSPTPAPARRATKRASARGFTPATGATGAARAKGKGRS